MPFYGFAALCIDHPEVQALYGRITDRRVVTYGFSPQADVRALPPAADADGEMFDVVIRAKNGEGERRLERVRLSLPGLHNVPNALAAIAVARELGIPDEVVRRTLSGLEGVKRRFTRTGTVDGVGIIDDYGHHPVEIRAVLRTARARTKGRVIAVVQPHRYTPPEACSTSSAPASTTPTRCWWPRSTPPARRRSRASTATRWSRASAATATATCGRSTGPTIWRRWSPTLARPGDLVVCLGCRQHHAMGASAAGPAGRALEKGAGEA